jgi:hypothetical protein
MKLRSWARRHTLGAWGLRASSECSWWGDGRPPDGCPLGSRRTRLAGWLVFAPGPVIDAAVLVASIVRERAGRLRHLVWHGRGGTYQPSLTHECVCSSTLHYKQTRLRTSRWEVYLGIDRPPCREDLIATSSNLPISPNRPFAPRGGRLTRSRLGARVVFIGADLRQNGGRVKRGNASQPSPGVHRRPATAASEPSGPSPPRGTSAMLASVARDSAMARFAVRMRRRAGSSEIARPSRGARGRQDLFGRWSGRRGPVPARGRAKTQE